MIKFMLRTLFMKMMTIQIQIQVQIQIQIGTTILSIRIMTLRLIQLLLLQLLLLTSDLFHRLVVLLLLRFPLQILAL